jgi:hypothetical protein
MTTFGATPEMALTLRINSQLREYSSALREYSRCARADAQAMRSRTRAVRERAERMRLLLGPGDADVFAGESPSDNGVDQLGGSSGITFEEVVDLLVTEHGFARIDALLDVAAEMEREDLPIRCNVLTPSQALDAMHHILQRH